MQRGMQGVQQEGATVRIGSRMQSRACSLYTLPSQQESERCCDGFTAGCPVSGLRLGYDRQDGSTRTRR